MNKQNKPERIIKKPNIPEKELEKGLPDEQVQDRTHYAQCLLIDDDLAEQVSERVSFDQILFQQVRMNNTLFKQTQVLDSRLTGCDLANAEWFKAAFHRVELLDCHLTGFRSPEANFQDTLFKECSAAFAQFRFATFKTVLFESCDLSDADFEGANFSGVTFTNCNLRNVELLGAKLVGVDLRGSKIDGLRAGPRELKGAILDPAQALAFVRGLGIKVEYLEEDHEERRYNEV